MVSRKPNHSFPLHCDFIDLPTSIAYNVGMKRRQEEKSIQLTVRGVPSQVKKTLMKRADSERKSLNAILVEALSDAAGLASQPTIYCDLDHLAGRWVEDPDFDKAIADQDQIDDSMWP
jgi:hypothetical protein